MRLSGHRRLGIRLTAASVSAAIICATLIVVLRQSESPSGSSAVSAPSDPVFVPGPRTFSPGLHLLGALSPSVAYILETRDGLILIDTGLKESHSSLLDQLRVLGLNVADLKLILITHGHGDHYLGAKQLRELTGARIYAGAADSAVLRNAGPREAVFSTFQMNDVTIEPAVVDVELSGGEVIELGETVIKVIATPGHTPGSVCYLVEWHDETVLFSGDTIMTIEGDLGTYATYLAPRYRGDAESYLETLKELQWLPVPDLLLPGHPQTTSRLISARVTPEKWNSMLSNGIRDMEQLVSRHEADGADFLDGNHKKIMEGLMYLGDVHGNAVYCLSEQSSLALINAPGGSSLVGFLQERLAMFGYDLSQLDAVVLTGTAEPIRSGLTDLISATGCQVIAPQIIHEKLATVMPDVTPASIETPPQRLTWLNLNPVYLRGFGSDQVAYLQIRDNKRVLFTGLTPLTASPDALADLGLVSVDLGHCRFSISQLAKVQPDVWLPSRPVHGQNANLYDRDWATTIRDCGMFLGISYR